MAVPTYYVPLGSSSLGALLDQGALTAAVCLLLASANLASAPDAPARQWMLPVCVAILAVTAQATVYTSLGAASAAAVQVAGRQQQKWWRHRCAIIGAADVAIAAGTDSAGRP